MITHDLSVMQIVSDRWLSFNPLIVQSVPKFFDSAVEVGMVVLGADRHCLFSAVSFSKLIVGCYCHHPV